MSNNSFDVIIIGAGISGINSSYRLQEAFPNYSYAILEGREEIGGTWSFFNYPGIRSDSDLHTLGFPWYPWTADNAIAGGAAILDYLKSAAAKFGIDHHCKYRHMVKSMNWSTENQHWKLEVLVDENEVQFLYARNVMLGTGYFDYTQGLEAMIPGISDFQGTVVHPQFWPKDLDYANKKVVIIGSGATAVTLLPAMSEKTKSIIMLQRSPGYLINRSAVDSFDLFVKKWLPSYLAFPLIRLRMVMLTHFLVYSFKLFPNLAIRFLQNGTARQLPANIPVDPHFMPRYRPFEQRLCLTPGGDFFAALRSGKCDIATDTIDTVTESGIKLHSGKVLDAEIIITATGLRLRFAGNIEIFVDNEHININEKFTWRGALIQDLPNLAYVNGYTTFSWTLGADATAQLWVRLLSTARQRNATSIVPRVDMSDEHMIERPYWDLTSTYIQAGKARHIVPKCGDRSPWLPRRVYLKDIWHAKFGDATRGLEFIKVEN